MTIPIFFATDENYVPYCGVAVYSLIEHASKNNKYNIYILFDRLSCMSIYRLEQFSTENVKVLCVCIHDGMKKYRLQEHLHISVAATYRLLIADLHPELDKALYLDSDIVINSDIAELYEINIADYYLGAVKGKISCQAAESMRSYIKTTLKIDETHFFNSGVLLINMAKFRERRIKEKCFGLLAERDDLLMMDQDVLNIVCEDKVKFLPEEWNVECVSVPDYSCEYVTTSTSTTIKYTNRIGIIHFDGPVKPWDKPSIPLAECFWEYARKSVFYEEIINRMYAHEVDELCATARLFSGCKKVIVYGAGVRGRRYIQNLIRLNMCRIIAWVDNNYNEITV